MLPEDRLNLLYNVEFAKDDFRPCLYSMTKEEEEQLLNKDVFSVLRLYLQWPMQSLFLETAEKTRNYIGDRGFKLLLSVIFCDMTLMKGFDYYELFENFWNRSSNSLKESSRGDPHFRERIESCFEEIRRKREAYNNERVKWERKVNSETKRKKGNRKNRRTHSKKLKKNKQSCFSLCFDVSL
ncbi:hypothetical protein AVEN_26684-1 [Araneus ventricosus]|uniref:Uncharacterized protein n=1 Tax=Araneus ventricosus TaxID=182803 RepID=A0A4Y2NS08_ARAVE|nr:hypothetical protein AVEN_26684-1 [Araneus ventricosus]